MVTTATPDTVAICLIVNDRLTRKPALRIPDYPIPNTSGQPAQSIPETRAGSGTACGYPTGRADFTTYGSTPDEDWFKAFLKDSRAVAAFTL